MKAVENVFTIKEVLYVVGPMFGLLVALVAWLFKEWYKGLNKKIAKRDEDISSMAGQVAAVNRTLETHKKAITDNIVEFKTDMIKQQEKVNSSIYLHRTELQKAKHGAENNERAILQAIQDLKAVEKALYSSNKKISEFTTKLDELAPVIKKNTDLSNGALQVVKKHNLDIKTINRILSDHKMLIITERKKKD